MCGKPGENKLVIVKTYKANNQKTIIVIQADEAQQRQDCQYSIAIIAATSNRSQIQIHVSKRVYFSPVKQMSSLLEDTETQLFVFNNCQDTFNMTGSSAGAVPCSDK